MLISRDGGGGIAQCRQGVGQRQGLHGLLVAPISTLNSKTSVVCLGQVNIAGAVTAAAGKPLTAAALLPLPCPRIVDWPACPLCHCWPCCRLPDQGAQGAGCKAVSELCAPA